MQTHAIEFSGIQRIYDPNEMDAMCGKRHGISERDPTIRPQVRWKSLYIGDEKLWIRGVTYGTFRPDDHGNEFHDPKKVANDFAQMVECGINAVRTYTPPPRWLLGIAPVSGRFEAEERRPNDHAAL